MTNRNSLRLSAALLLVGQLLYIVFTQFHTGGPANNHPVIFAAYAGSGIWTAVHVGQFACTGSLGLESGINWLYAPGLVTFDMSLQKEFSVKERVRFQLRVDAFNVFNLIRTSPDSTAN